MLNPFNPSTDYYKQYCFLKYAYCHYIYRSLIIHEATMVFSLLHVFFKLLWGYVFHSK